MKRNSIRDLGREDDDIADPRDDALDDQVLKHPAEENRRGLRLHERRSASRSRP